MIILHNGPADATATLLFVSDIAIFVLKRDVKLQLTNRHPIISYFIKIQNGKLTTLGRLIQVVLEKRLSIFQNFLKGWGWSRPALASDSVELNLITSPECIVRYQ